MTLSHPFRSVLSALRANLAPALALQAFALAILLLYRFHPPSRHLWEILATRRAEGGLVWDMMTTGLFGAAIPFVIMQFRKGNVGRYRPLQMAALLAFWTYKGLEVSFFYRFQAMTFGSGASMSTLLLKATVDQLLYCPMVAVPFTWAIYAWVDRGFKWSAVLSEVRRPGWYLRCCLPLLIATWLVWGPAVLLIYTMPTVLQLPMQNLVQCFFTLLLLFLTHPRQDSRIAVEA